MAVRPLLGHVGKAVEQKIINTKNPTDVRQSHWPSVRPLGDRRRISCPAAVPTYFERPFEEHPISAVEFQDKDLDIDSLDGRVLAIFRWPAALEGREVSVIGSFNDWKTPLALRVGSENGDFVRSIALPPGQYQYRFQVDGKWATSPCEATAGDGKGHYNNQRLVAESCTFSWLSKWGGKEVFVTGDFNSWTELIQLQRKKSGDFEVRCSLPPGMYSYQFLVDDQWMTAPAMPVAPDDKGHLCNRVKVNPPPAFHIFYATGWQEPILHALQLSSGKESKWHEFPLSRSPSRASVSGGSWYTASLPASRSVQSEKLEFYIESRNAKGELDRPVSGGNYLCPKRGGYKLQCGRLTPFSRGCAPPTMLVSDLDGTMVGEGEAADLATRDFCDYWEGNAALSGSVLVYNTGRSLGQFISLMHEKGGALAVPDALITAVGTKIFLLGHDGQGRGTAATECWKEDVQWARRLDQGWDLTKVKQVAGDIVIQLSEEDAGHWLDHGTEHPHRIALSVRADRVPLVVERLKMGFQGHSLQVQIIISGVGDWRYLDCVAVKGGKLKALEYVRTLFSIPQERCVAAGDSGNDILMLEGETKAIVVGNAQPELVDWLLQQPQDDRLIYTDAHLAHGVLEGMSRHGLY